MLASRGETLLVEMRDGDPSPQGFLLRREPFGIIALPFAPNRGLYDSGSVRREPEPWWWQAEMSLPLVVFSHTKKSIGK